MKSQTTSDQSTVTSKKSVKNIKWSGVQHFLNQLFFYEEDEIRMAQLKIKEVQKKKD